MRDSISAGKRGRRANLQGVQCGTCRWYDGIFDCCRFHSETGRDRRDCKSYSPDCKSKGEEAGGKWRLSNILLRIAWIQALLCERETVLASTPAGKQTRARIANCI